MNKSYLFISLFVLICFNGYAQLDWNKIHGTNEFDNPRQLIRIEAGGFYFVVIIL